MWHLLCAALLFLPSSPTLGARGKRPWEPMCLNSEKSKSAEVPGEATRVEDEGSSKIPKHEFKIRTTVGAYGKMKGVTRQFVTLVAPPHEFKRKSKTKGDGTEVFICSECDALGKTVKAPAFKTIKDKEDETKDEYVLFEDRFPDRKDHICAPSGYADAVDKCKLDMLR